MSYLCFWGQRTKASQLTLSVSPDGASARCDAGMDLPQIKRRDAALNAKEYLEQHAVLQYLQGLLEALVQDKPEDPYGYMWQQLNFARTPPPPPPDPRTPRTPDAEPWTLPSADLKDETWLLLGSILHFCLLWFSGTSPLNC